ncbi:MAG: hypothetical protein OXG26_22125 [Caldilineaceae bacterium]|uniref:Uncharacterized protein n=1 Tax=Caldilineaceae bacterium SB0661_bin_32 TaxID=2605255 RepID=A0A6B1D5W4_9CHLR|nr:hypothetical protein [Caldilineaceae bacterium]MDE0633213.1 hypothetical protein [Caldilineaceae bacterium]MXZ21954.1 hypothetical protein [Caldilineaceae bacterium SB0665_bin_25]MYC95280.1 hypothetical protein [Caldilineaceae bacterium SB0661_bin_32]
MIRKTYDIVPDTGDQTYPVLWHIHTLWQTDEEGLLREFHSTYTSLDKAEDAVRERLILAGHRPDVSALAAQKIAVRALSTYMDQLDDAEWVDGVLGDALDGAEDDSR